MPLKKKKDEKQPLLCEEPQALVEKTSEPNVSVEHLDDTSIRIVLVGKSGTGKSASGNTILGEKKFPSKASSSPVTPDCDKCLKILKLDDGETVKLAVIDTPGLFDRKLTEEQVKRETEKQSGRDTEEQIKRQIEGRLQREKEKNNEEIARCIALATPGPHVFLVVIGNDRFSKEAQETVETIQRIFGKGAASYTMALFTYGDNLKADGVHIEDLIKENEHLHDFITKTCGNRYHVFNNREKDPSQVKVLVQKINTMVEANGGRYYTTEMLRKAERIVREEQVRIQRENPSLSSEEARKQAETMFKVIKSIAAIASVGGGVGSAIGIGVDIALGASAGAIGGPVGAAIGAGLGLAVGTVTAVVVMKKASDRK